MNQRSLRALAALALALVGGAAAAQPIHESRTLVEQAPAAAGSTVIDGDTLRDEGVDSLAEALDLGSGVSLTRQSGLGTSATLDGLPAGQVIVLVDGVPIGRALNTRAGPAFDVASLPIDLSTVDRIIVTRGLGPAGSGTSGGIIIQILTSDTRRETEVFVDVDGSANRLGTSAANGQAGLSAPLSDSVTIRARGQATREVSQDASGDGQPDVPARSLATGSLGLSIDGPRGGKLSVGGEIGFVRTRRNSLTADRERELRADSVALLNGEFDDRTDLLRGLVRVDGNATRTDGLTLDSGTSWQMQEVAFDKVRLTDDEVEPNQITRDHVVRQNVTLGIRTGAHLVEPELDLRLNQTSRTGANTSFSETAFAAALGATWRVLASDAIQLGARGVGDAHTDFGVGGVVGVDAELDAGERITVVMAGSRSRRTPIPEELYFRFDHSDVGYVLVGNRHLRPERLWSGRLGVRIRWEDWVAEVEGFLHQLDQTIGFEVIDTEGGVATYRYVNVGEVSSAGATTSVGVLLARTGLSLRVSYTATPHSRSEQTRGRAPLTPVHDAEARLAGSWSRDRLGGWVRSSLRSDSQDIEGRSTGEVGLVDLAVWARVTPAVRVSAEVDNVTSTFDRIVGPFRPVTARIGLRYDSH